jgi:hypothetical protein
MYSARYVAVYLLIFCVGVAGLTGCGSSGPKRYGVSGSVKYKNEPIKFGTISFRSEDGTTSGAQIKDGKYDIPASGGLPPGKYRVAINYPDPKAPKPKEDELPGEVTAAKDLLPDRYHNNTELTAEIKAEHNQVDFDLK